jgi:hypothetical protein
MKPFKEVERRGKTVLWTTPDEGKLFELAEAEPNVATVWQYHFYVESGTELSEPDDDGWMQILPPSRMNGRVGNRVREFDAPVPPWKQLGQVSLSTAK